MAGSDPGHFYLRLMPPRLVDRLCLNQLMLIHIVEDAARFLAAIHHAIDAANDCPLALDAFERPIIGRGSEQPKRTGPLPGRLVRIVFVIDEQMGVIERAGTVAVDTNIWRRHQMRAARRDITLMLRLREAVRETLAVENRIRAQIVD